MGQYAHPETLVETDWLAEHANDPKVRIFEVDVDTSSYDQGHAAGAIGVNWKSDLQQQPVRDLLDKKQLEEFLSKNGVTKDTTIAVFGDNNNWFAAWFLWLLKYYGHKDVRLVNGGRAKWVAEGRALVTEKPSFQRSEYKAQGPDASIRALRDYVLERHEDHRREITEGVLGRTARAGGASAGGRTARRAHPPRAERSVGDGGRRGRSLQERGRAEDDLRGQGAEPGHRNDCLLPHRRAQRPHLVRAALPAGSRASPQL
jgi:hypothetical protein